MGRKAKATSGSLINVVRVVRVVRVIYDDRTGHTTGKGTGELR